jgi:ribosomal 30S subunit maturation factor RimM
MNPLDNRFTEIGRFGRPHGLDGNIRFKPNDNFIDSLFDQIQMFYIKNERSDLVPCSRSHLQICRGEKKSKMFFVKFDSIANRQDAEQAMNRALYVQLPKSLKSSNRNQNPNRIHYLATASTLMETGLVRCSMFLKIRHTRSLKSSINPALC